MLVRDRLAMRGAWVLLTLVLLLFVGLELNAYATQLGAVHHDIYCQEH